jgi:hypothetical protein
MATTVKPVAKTTTPAKRKLPEPLQSFTIKEYDPASDILKLAKKSASLLKYDGLLTHLRQPLTLGKALIDLDIHPLDEKSVETYKLKELRAARRKYKSNYSTTYTIRWRTIELSKYEKPIPEFALAKAVEIAEKVKNAQFSVEELTVSAERVVHDRDPFLIVTAGRETFYIEVWDEPKFETKLIDN